MKNALLYFSLLLTPLFLYSQVPPTPSQESGFSRVTGHHELLGYLQIIESESPFVTVDIIGRSVEGREIAALMFSKTKFGADPGKVRVLIFAQQHGNEQSGKEAALLLARELSGGGYDRFFDKIDLMLIPQLNPDGSEVNRRRNASDIDLNRNHLILTEPETRALHRQVDRYGFQVSCDVHEYSPYGDDWKKAGFRKNSEVTAGTATNLNVSQEIRDISREFFLPFILDAIREKGFSALEYYPGGPPPEYFLRRSTFDINDGRQSLAIQNSFSFIQEGMNGRDSYTDNLENRARGQMAGMLGLLEFVYANSDLILNTVAKEKSRIVSGEGYSSVIIQAEHVETGEALLLPGKSTLSGTDTTVTVRQFRPGIRPLLEVERPLGYLVPASDALLKEWVRNHSLENSRLKDTKGMRIMEYLISGIDSVDFEGERTIDPMVTLRQVPSDLRLKDYIFIPVSQVKGNMIVIALEPRSMCGLSAYSRFEYLWRDREVFPVMRVERTFSDRAGD